MKIRILFFLIFFLTSTSTFANGIYYEKKNSPYKILQKTISNFYQADTVTIAAETWLQGPYSHIGIKTTSLIKGVDDYKLQGRVSLSSIAPELKFSTSSWIQAYKIRGVSFSWSSTERKWKNEALEIGEEKVREKLQYSLLRSLFNLNEETVNPSTMEYIGIGERQGKVCFVIGYEFEKDMFTKWGMVGNLSAKLWIEKETFLPVAQRTEGRLGDMNLLQIVSYFDYNEKAGFDIPSFIAKEVEKEKDDLKDTISKLTQKVAELRGWEPLDDIEVKFADRGTIRDVVSEDVKKRYSQEELEQEEKIFKWLNLIPQEASYKDMLINAQVSLIGGLYSPKDGISYLGDWLQPSLAEIISVHEMVHAYQDKKIGLQDFLKKGKGNLDLKLALKSLIEGEAFAVSLEYLLNKDGSSFKDWDQVDSLIEDQIFKNGYHRSKLFYNLYGYGAAFIQACLKRYGWNELGRVYEDYPRSMKEVIQPLVYFLRHEVDRGGRKTARQQTAGPKQVFMPSLPGGWSRVYSTTVGNYLLILSLSSELEKTAAEDAIAGWENDKLIIYKNEDKKELFTWVLKWHVRRNAENFYKAYRKWARKRGYNKKTIFELFDNYVIIIWTDDLGKDEFDSVANEVFSLLR